VPSIEHQPASSSEDALCALQSDVDDYLSERLSFDELRTRWITAVSNDSDVRIGALRILYRKPLVEQLPESSILSLKRIIETALDDDPDDWTVEMEAQQRVSSSTVLPQIRRDSAKHSADTSDAGDQPDAGSVFQNPATPSRATAASADRPDPVAEGQIINGRFELLERLGGGGNGIVYRAIDRLREHTNAPVTEIAVKFLRADMRSDARRIEALRREALLTQGLSHPNIVRVYDFHEDTDTCFLTMELLQGELLRTLLAREYPGAVSKERAYGIVEGMCRGLAHAHASGCAHADLKPGNIYLTAGDVPKIFDFGLAHSAPSGADGGEAPAESGSTAIRANSPAYASCDRLEGGEPTFSDDIFSLSCVIYELLSGRHPYQRKLATEAKASGLRPDRIASLGDREWEVLSAGLELHSADRSADTNSLLEAFTEKARIEPSRVPVARKSLRAWSLVGMAAAFLLGAGGMLALTLLDFEPVDATTAAQIRESQTGKFLRSKLGVARDQAAAADSQEPREQAADVVPVSDGAAGGVDGTPTPELGAPAGVPESGGPAISSATGAEPDDPSGAAVEEQSQVEASVLPALADDVPEAAAVVPGFRFGSPEYSVSEGDAALAIEIIRLGGDSGPVDVELTTYGRSAKTDTDFVPFSAHRLRFADGEMSRILFIPIIDDAVPESEEIFEIVLGTTNAQMVLKEPSSAMAIIIDDDA